MIKDYFFVLYVWRQIYNDPDINIANVIGKTNEAVWDGNGTPAKYIGKVISVSLLFAFIFNIISQSPG
jgi:hypothetical protein